MVRERGGGAFFVRHKDTANRKGFLEANLDTYECWSNRYDDDEDTSSMDGVLSFSNSRLVLDNTMNHVVYFQGSRKQEWWKQK